MALVIDLKPQEKILIGEAVVTNGDARARFTIEGDVPILRQKDVMKPEQADTPCKRIYLLVQCMYIARDPRGYHGTYFANVRDVQEAAPSTAPFFADINMHIIAGKYFQALKVAKKLIAYERSLLDHALGHSDTGKGTDGGAQ
jgi:flagellar biosynthesis repressor protein FlbT